MRNANALIRRLETGLSGTDLRPATLTAPTWAGAR